MPAWMAIYHDENCKNIMNIATEYVAGNLTKAEAKARLDDCDLTHKKDFKDSMQTILNDICSTKAAKTENVKSSEKVVKKTEEI